MGQRPSWAAEPSPAHADSGVVYVAPYHMFLLCKCRGPPYPSRVLTAHHHVGDWRFTPLDPLCETVCLWVHKRYQVRSGGDSTLCLSSGRPLHRCRMREWRYVGNDSTGLAPVRETSPPSCLGPAGLDGGATIHYAGVRAYIRVMQFCLAARTAHPHRHAWAS